MVSVVTVSDETEGTEGIDCLVGRPGAGRVIRWLLAAGLFYFGVAVVGAVSVGVTGALFAVASGAVVRLPAAAWHDPRRPQSGKETRFPIPLNETRGSTGRPV